MSRKDTILILLDALEALLASGTNDTGKADRAREIISRYRKDYPREQA